MPLEKTLDEYGVQSEPEKEKPEEKKDVPYGVNVYGECGSYRNKYKVCAIANCPRKYFNTSSGRLYITDITEKEMAEYSYLCEHKIPERSKQFSIDFKDGQFMITSPLLCPFPSRKGHMMLMVSTGGEGGFAQSQDASAHIFIQFGFFGRCLQSKSLELFQKFATIDSETCFKTKRSKLTTKVKIKDRLLTLTLQLPKPNLTRSRTYEFFLTPGRRRTARGMDAIFVMLSLNGMTFGLTYSIHANINKEKHDDDKKIRHQ